ncbi:MAG: UDP-glucose/GDP-mannose dehydrogenase family protein [candidate division Zixibacteria bacterium]|nr:UDP-glucose/GDP-mannose dehydrogenase family protein [Candidatus Tariuqbacter arcticus]
MKLCVVGTGYVGLVTGTCLANTGNNVIGVDIVGEKIAKLQKGELPIYEPGLKEILVENMEKGRLQFTTDIDNAVKNSLIIFITVGTPSDVDGSADLKAVLQVAASVGKAMNEYKIIVDKSTVPVGTALKVTEEIKKYTQEEFDVVSNPEFLKEGYAIEDFMKPDRVVIGADSERAKKVMRDLYAPFVRTGSPVIFMSVKAAEITKYAANALLATKVTFMNEIANFCDEVGADVNEVRMGIGADKRIGPRFLFPGVGYGGSCFPKDVRALIRTAKDCGSSMQILEAVEEVNIRQKTVLFEKAFRHYKGSLKGLKFGIWGLAFKPRTDDMREAPSIEIINKLLKAGAKVSAHDPKAIDTAEEIFGDKVEFHDDQYRVLDDADALMLITEWNEFREPDFDMIKKRMKKPVIFDGRNIWSPRKMAELEFTYYCIGRP